ncbi:hypothetical protein [Gluconobacter oxydans]|uniref:hypothetical protein n=1 Tax=Gluconobacter oxydans TaxID=442 RepID=UPI0039EA7C2D
MISITLCLDRVLKDHVRARLVSRDGRPADQIPEPFDYAGQTGKLPVSRPVATKHTA